MEELLGIRLWVGACVLCVVSVASRAATDVTCDSRVPFIPHPPAGVATLNDDPKIPFLSVSTHTEFLQRQVLDLADNLWASWKSNTGHRMVEANRLFCGPNCYFDVPAGKAVNTLVIWADQAGLEARFWEQVFATALTRPVKGCYPPLEALRAMFADTPLGKTGIIPDLVYSDITNRGDVGLYYFDVRAGDATVTLTELASEAKLQVLYEYQKVAGKKTTAVKGFYPFGAAFRSMVGDGSLRYAFVNARTLSITGAPSTPQLAPKTSP